MVVKQATEAFEAVGLDTDIMSHKFAKGGKSSQEAFK